MSGHDAIFEEVLRYAGAPSPDTVLFSGVALSLGRFGA